MIFKVGEQLCKYAFSEDFCKNPIASVGVMTFFVLITGIAISRFFISKNTSDTNFPHSVTIDKTDPNIKKAMTDEELRRYFHHDVR